MQVLTQQNEGRSLAQKNTVKGGCWRDGDGAPGWALPTATANNRHGQAVRTLPDKGEAAALSCATGAEGLAFLRGCPAPGPRGPGLQGGLSSGEGAHGGHAPGLHGSSWEPPCLLVLPHGFQGQPWGWTPGSGF